MTFQTPAAQSAKHIEHEQVSRLITRKPKITINYIHAIKG